MYYSYLTLTDDLKFEWILPSNTHSLPGLKFASQLSVELKQGYSILKAVRISTSELKTKKTRTKIFKKDFFSGIISPIVKKIKKTEFHVAVRSHC
jgi:hypothetical protein